MTPRRHHREREGVMAMIGLIRPVAAVGVFALAAPLLSPGAVQASQTGKTTLIVAQAAGDRQNAATGTSVRRLIMAALAQRGHTVFDGDGGATPSAPGAAILWVATEIRVLPGAYTTHATVGLRATLIDGGTKRFVARFDLGPGTPWRLAEHCRQSCIDRDVQHRVRPLVVSLAADVDRRLTQLGRDRRTAADAAGISVAFRHIDRKLLPQIEQYLRHFPGVSRVRRDQATGEGVLYRLKQDGTAGETDLSLRKLLHHLQLKARVTRTGNSYVVEADPTVAPAATRDW